MSAKHFVKKSKLKLSGSMKGWEGMHVGSISCYRTKKRHKKYRYGAKKGLRRARRRVSKKIIQKEMPS
jgi:hypothetical protein